ERKEAGAEADAGVGPEETAQERGEDALQVGEARPLVDQQPLDLLEHRRVRRIGIVAPVARPRHHDPDGRRRAAQTARLQVGGVLRVTRSCTGEVCVRSRGRPESARKKVSCASRAGWSGGKLSPPKLWKSSSTSGPSATENPMETKMSTRSSSVCRRGWRCP